jgi:type II secretory pathway component PulC
MKIIGFAIVAFLISFPSQAKEKEEIGGCKISQVQKDGMWAQLGLKNGDELLSFNGKKARCTSEADLLALFQEMGASQKVVMKIRRAGKIETLTFDIKEEAK